MPPARSWLPAHTAARLPGGRGRPCASNERGLTVFELLVAMTVSGILSAIAVVAYGNALHRARVGKAIAEIRLIEREIAKYEIDFGEVPDGLERIRWRANDPWNHPYRYLRIQFKDRGGGNDGGEGHGGGNGGGRGGGGREGGCPGGHGHPEGARKDRFLVPINCDYDLYSMGPDGETTAPLTARKSRDDIIRAGDGAFVGPASEF